MLTKLLVAPFFIAASAVAHPAVQRRADADVPLSSWSSGNLESYWRYKNRYNSLGCSSQVGTDYYTNCCYPLGASESLSDRPAECTPTSQSCGSPVGLSSTPTPAPETNTPTTNTPTDTSSNDNYSSDNYDESNLPWCEAGQSEYDDDDTYTDASWNNGGSSSDTYTPPASDNSQAQPTPDNSGNTGNTGNTGGDTSGNWIGGGMATYYYQNNNAGACGDYHGDYDMIGAIDVAWYGDMGQKSQYCGRAVRIKNLNNGRTVDIIVADVCPTCATDNSFDLSEGAFKALDDTSVGTFPIEWSFI